MQQPHKVEQYQVKSMQTVYCFKEAVGMNNRRFIVRQYILGVLSI